MELPFMQVDVFTSVPFLGNPVAVVFDADDLNADQMQRIAKWTNLSETTFVQTPEKGDYRLRIFTPGSELPFAGHPTIGSARAVLKRGIIPPGKKMFFQECGAGLVRIRTGGEDISARVPGTRILDMPLNREAFEEAAGCPLGDVPVAIDAGPVWAVASVATPSALLDIRVDADAVAALSRSHGLTGITLYAIDRKKGVFLRTFAPAIGVNEDPVCGSGNAAVAAHIRRTGRKEIFGDAYTAYQGEALGRSGIIRVSYDGDDICIGGNSVVVIEGTIRV